MNVSGVRRWEKVKKSKVKEVFTHQSQDFWFLSALDIKVSALAHFKS